MEWCDGGDLSKKKGIGESETVYYLRQIATALKHMHENSVLHRDLKPANIMLSDNSPSAKVKITDFGLAR
jgi:serine/threonine-protein kinase